MKNALLFLVVIILLACKHYVPKENSSNQKDENIAIQMGAVAIESAAKLEDTVC